MEEKNTARYKSRQYAIRIIKLYRHLKTKYHEYDLFRQILRSGTSIGANLSEAEFAISEQDFAAKIYIALKECSETLYWLWLLHQTGYLTDAEYNSMDRDGREIEKMLSATTKTLKEKNQ